MSTERDDGVGIAECVHFDSQSSRAALRPEYGFIVCGSEDTCLRRGGQPDELADKPRLQGTTRMPALRKADL